MLRYTKIRKPGWWLRIKIKMMKWIGLGPYCLLLLMVGSAEGASLPYYFGHPIKPVPLFQLSTFAIVKGWDGSSVFNVGDAANLALRVNVVAGGAGGGTVTQGPGAGAATNFWNVRLTDGTSFLPLPAALGGSGGLKIECLSGCGGAAAFADAAAFTFGTTSVGIFAAVVDDVATNTVAENSAGAPRMNTNRILYTLNTNSTGGEVGTAGSPFRVDPTGSTTQPVSGTFFQATQPISATSLPLPTGAATAALQTQPGVDIGDVTINNGAGASAVNIQDGGNSITVDGTVAVSTALLLDATYTGRMPAGASPADNESNTNTALSRIGTFPFVFDGTTWDRQPGNSASGTKVFFSQTTTDNDVDVLTLPANASVNVAQIAANTTVTAGVSGLLAVGGAAASGATKSGNPVEIGGVFNTTPPTVASGQTVEQQMSARGEQFVIIRDAAGNLRGANVDANNNVSVGQATAANLNVRDDTSGATGSAVPARATYVGVGDGTNTQGLKSVSAANLSLGATNLTGVALTDTPCEWTITSVPAANAQATASRAANASGRHVAKFYLACFAAAATGGPANVFRIRDGATGAGTVIWAGVLASNANAAACAGQEITLIGTTNTAMTIEFAAAGGNTTQETVSLCGYDTN